MGKDVLTTIGGLILVGIVVVATFLYGNQQRQAQLRHDSEVQKQTQQTTQDQNKNNQKSSSGNQSASSGGDSQGAQQPAVQKPSSSNQTDLQGGSQQPASSGAASDQSASNAQSTPTPASGETPRTGGGLIPVAAATLMAVLGLSYRRSRHSLAEAMARS